MNENSISDLLNSTSREYAEKPAYRFKRAGTWREISWRENAEVVRQIARSLLALELAPGDKVAILSQTRLEWVQCELAAVCIGCVTAGIYTSNPAEECAYILNHSEAKILFVENDAQLNKILSVRNNLTHLQHIVLLDGVPPPRDIFLSWEAFLQKGESQTAQAVRARAAAIKPADLATIVYTSGTTGIPKGAMLTHENVLFTSWSVQQCLHVEPHFETLLFLPLAHVFARMTIYAALRGGTTVAFAENLQAVPDNIREIRPHFFGSAPRIYEKIYERILSGVENQGGLKKVLFYRALKIGERVSRRLQKKRPVPAALRFLYRVATALVFEKIQAAFGGRLVYAISGAAPLNPDIARFFHACGILILEGIGMTENTSFTNVNRFDHYKFGTVGPPGPLIEQKLAPDGEILYRGKNVMAGYFKDPESTAAAIDTDGWLHTGDICEIDEDGFVRVTDRKKDLIITAGGKNVAPQKIERILRTSRFISQVVAVGDRRKFLSALITLNQPEVETWAVENAIDSANWPGLIQKPAVHALIAGEIETRNRELASFETIKKFRILPDDFSIASGEMTPTLKLKRKKIIDRYKDLIDELYASADV